MTPNRIQVGVERGKPSSDAPLRVLLVSPAFSPELGGVETHTREVAARLAAAGIETGVLTTDRSHRLVPHDRIRDVPVRRVRAWPRDHDARFAPGLIREVIQGGWDVVHVQCYQSLVAPVAMASAAAARVPYVLTFHGGGHSLRYRSAIRKPQLRVLGPLLRRARRLIATAEWEVDHYASLLDIPRDHFLYIPNGGDLPAPDDALVGEDRAPVIISPGRLERFKGHDLAIRVLPHLTNKFPDARLLIAGDGPDGDRLRALASDLGVADRVEIRAIRDRREYASRLAPAAAAVLLSEFETHPMAALEAISLGVPMLVAEDDGGLSELVRKGLARGVSRTDGPQSHAAALAALIDAGPTNHALALSSWDDCTRSLIALYEAIARPGAD